MPKQIAVHRIQETMPNEPRMASMLAQWPAVVSTRTKIMLTLEIGATIARTAAAPVACHALSARPTASGISIITMSDLAMLIGSTDTPESSCGRTIGM